MPKWRKDAGETTKVVNVDVKGDTATIFSTADGDILHPRSISPVRATGIPLHNLEFSEATGLDQTSRTELQIVEDELFNEVQLVLSKNTGAPKGPRSAKIPQLWDLLDQSIRVQIPHARGRQEQP